MATSTITEQVEENSLTSIQQLISTPMRITRSYLTQVNDNVSFIEGLPNTDLADKCNDLVARKLINIRESNLNETGVLSLPNDHIVEFHNGFKPTPADDKFIETECYSKPFPSLTLKGSKEKLIFNFLGTYIKL